MARFRYAAKLSRDIVGFARENRVYWIIPLVVVLGLIGLVVVVSQTAAPLIYTLF